MRESEKKREEFFRSSFLHLMEDVKHKGYMKTTNFLPPAGQNAAFSLLLSEKSVKGIAYGGFFSCERAMIGVYPASFEFSKEDFPCLCVKASVRDLRGLSGRALPTHRDYLGALLALGVKREKIGDILVSEGKALIAAHAELAGFLQQELSEVGRHKVEVQVLLGFDGLQAEIKKEKKSDTIASPRLDAVVSAVLNLSREKAAALIEGEKVLIGGRAVTKVHAEIKAGDLVSVRGKGKFEIEDLSRLTKKNRRVLEYFRYI